MKLKIKSLGPLTDTELDLGDLTVLFGPPSSGKSYILKAIYSRMAFLDKANNYEFANLITSNFVKDLEKKALAGEREFTVNLIDPFLTGMEELVNHYAKFFFTSFDVELEGLEGVTDVVSDELKRVVTREETFTPYSQEVGVSVTYDRGIIRIKAKGESNQEISYYLPIALNEYLSTRVIPSVMAIVSEKYGKVKYIPFGREAILLLRPKIVTRQYRSLAYWLEKGINTLREKSLADEIFNVRISATESQGISVNGYPVHMTSSSLNEISVLDLLVHGVR
ncbi:MAG: hypothetical protein JZD40_03780, partial [Sulfolobus sp.]|nr:hypothetical protein [Sulfolobus sp.]